MRIRVRRWLRVLLFLAGVLLLAWLPISFFVVGYIRLEAHWVCAQNGYLSIGYGYQRTVEAEHFPMLSRALDGTAALPTPDSSPPDSWPDLEIRLHSSSDQSEISLQATPWPGRGLLPSFRRVMGWDLVIPLWMIIVVSLAWPTGSFVARRRKQKRGFPVVLVHA